MDEFTFPDHFFVLKVLKFSVETLRVLEVIALGFVHLKLELANQVGVGFHVVLVPVPQKFYLLLHGFYNPQFSFLDRKLLLEVGNDGVLVPEHQLVIGLHSVGICAAKSDFLPKVDEVLVVLKVVQV